MIHINTSVHTILVKQVALLTTFTFISFGLEGQSRELCEASINVPHAIILGMYEGEKWGETAE